MAEPLVTKVPLPMVAVESLVFHFAIWEYYNKTVL